MALSGPDRDELLTLAVRHRRLNSRQDIVADADRQAELHLIISGFAYRYKQLENGGRQIMGFLIPDDLCDACCLLLGRMDCSICALGPCEVAVIPHGRLIEFIGKHPRLAISLWRETALDAAIAREWLTNLGRRQAHARVSHLICELWYRLQIAGLAHDHSFDFPVTQAELADALGLSIVHVNRTLQLLRAEGLISPQASRIRLLDLPRLKEVAEFDPAYLQVHVQV